jgi:hypothetical protein
MKSTLRGLVALAVAGAALMIVVAVAVAATSGGQPRELEAVQAATARYQDVTRAEQDGYVRSSPCEQSPAGGMGFHYVNESLVMNPAIDPLRPEVMLYEPKRGGNLRLIGVEYLAVALANTPSGPAPWFAATPPPGGFFTPAPTLFGQTFDGPMAGHAPGMPWHYDLHVWIYKHNQSGMFSMWNPRVVC